MNIAFDCRCFLHEGGIKTAAINLIRNILKTDSNNNHYFLIYPSKEYLGLFKEKNVTEKFFKSKSNVFLLFWDQIYLPFFCRKNDIDCLIGLKNTVSFIGKFKKIVLVHDLIPYSNPETLRFLEKYYWQISFILLSQTKKKLLFNSFESLKDYKKYFPKDKSLKNVVYFGIPNKVQRGLNYNNSNIKKEKIILYVGDLIPRKNIPNLIKGFSLFQKKIKKDYKLYLVGKKTNNYDSEIDKIIKTYKLEENVIKTGFISNKRLNKLYKKAEIFTYISLKEGFGFPILEAMSYNLPVLTSRYGSLKEIAGNSALFVNPKKINEISQKLFDLATNKKLVLSLQKRSQKRLKIFSWEKVANIFLETIRK